MRFSDSFRAARIVRLVNLLAQAVLFLSLFTGLNYIALNHAWRFDVTQNRRHSLSAETESYLAGLEHPVAIYVTFTDQTDNPELAQSYRDLAGLLREYDYASRHHPHGRITYEFLDVYQNRARARARDLDQPNTVVLRSGERTRVMPLGEFYEINARQGRKEAFRGELALTAALLDVANPARKKIYFLQGHGELGPDDLGANGLSQLRDQLRARNYDLAALELATTRRIPEDAALLISAGPQVRYQPFEELLLREHLQTRAGRLILLLDPMRFHGLDNLLFDWGVVAYDNLIYDTDPSGMDEAGNLYLRHYAPHPITQTLIAGSLAVVVGRARVVRGDLGRNLDDGLDVRTIVATSPTAWGETNYRLPNPVFDRNDLRAKDGLGVVAVSDRLKPASLPLSVRGGRLVVFGTADLVTNNRLTALGNLNLFINTVNWAVDRDTQLSIPPRPIERFQLTLSQEELGRLRLGLLLIVPGAAALLGLFVYWTRRT